VKKNFILLLSFFFFSLSFANAEIFPQKRDIGFINYQSVNFSYPTKRPTQPELSQLLSNKDVELFKLALDKADAYKWDRVIGIQSNIKNETARDTLEWLKYYNGANNLTFTNYLDYIDQNNDWPEIEKIKIKSESKISFKENHQLIINHFKKIKPKTGWGNIYYGNALLNNGEIEKGKKYIIQGYTDGSFSRKEQSQILKNFKTILEENHHKKRIEQLLWNGKYRTASRLVKYVNKDYQKLFEARIGLISFAGGVDDLIKKVPDQLKSDPGLVYDRIHWRIKKRKYDSALNLLLEINNTDSSKLVRPDKFWGKKNFLIRKLIDRHEYNTAYKLSINHGLKENKDIAEAEWMAGWISLTFLENPESAYLHFKEIWDVSSRPISKARAAYWMGNSLDALGKTDDAQKEYLKASKYSLTFYGQLAASKLNNKILFSPKLTSKENTSSEKQEISNSVYLAISLLNEFDKSKLVKKFIWDLADRENLNTATKSVRIANELGRKDFAVQAGKILYYNHVLLDPLSFPEVERPKFDKIIFPPQSLIHSVTRQESQFDPQAGSYAGAKGLMQLMPYTAKRVSKGLKLEYTKSKLTEDPKYNVILGSAYLDKLLSNYNGSYILSLAAYNAGESRVSRWIKKYGDPRKDDITSEDWIELIPFKETRNYVQRVMENIQVYEFIENDLLPVEYTLNLNLNRAYTGGKTVIKPTKKQI